MCFELNQGVKRIYDVIILQAICLDWVEPYKDPISYVDLGSKNLG